MKTFLVCAMVLLLVGIAFSQDGPKVYSNYPEYQILEASPEGQFLAHDGTEWQWITIQDPSITMSDRIINLNPFEPVQILIFGDPEVGRITWEDGWIRFDGNFDESARVFFEYAWKEYCKGERR